MKKLPFFSKIIGILLIAGILIASAAQTYRISQHHQQSAISQITGDKKAKKNTTMSSPITSPPS